MSEDRVVVEICCENADHFREMALCDLVTIVRTVRWSDLTAPEPMDLVTRRKLLWDNSQSAFIESTGQVDYSVVDNRQDEDNSELSWSELYEQMREEGLV